MTCMRQRLLDNSCPEPNTGCWLWLLRTDRDGYGQIEVRSKTAKAHRIAYEAFVGPIAEGAYVLHSCDTPCCINPDHLSTGTQADNMREAVARKRTASGERHGLRKHPERAARGDRNGMRRYPERNARRKAAPC